MSEAIKKQMNDLIDTLDLEANNGDSLLLIVGKRTGATVMGSNTSERDIAEAILALTKQLIYSQGAEHAAKTYVEFLAAYSGVMLEIGHAIFGAEVPAPAFGMKH